MFVTEKAELWFFDSTAIETRHWFKTQSSTGRELHPTAGSPHCFSCLPGVTEQHHRSDATTPHPQQNQPPHLSDKLFPRRTVSKVAHHQICCLTIFYYTFPVLSKCLAVVKPLILLLLLWCVVGLTNRRVSGSMKPSELLRDPFSRTAPDKVFTASDIIGAVKRLITGLFDVVLHHFLFYRFCAKVMCTVD